MSNSRKASKPAAFMANDNWIVQYEAEHGKCTLSVGPGDELTVSFYLRSLADALQGGKFHTADGTGVHVILEHKRQEVQA
jgi:hypothetical protein